MASLTIHHWNDLSVGFREIARLQQDGGKLVIFTSTPEQMRGYWLNHYFPQMLEASIRQMPDEQSVLQAMEKAGLQLLGTEVYHVKDTLEDHFLYVGKERPELYLDARIRQGISSFSDLANAEEVSRGLARLQTDTENDAIAEIMAQYAQESGDYLFIIGKSDY